MNPRRLGRIARWEVSRSASTVDRRTVLVVAAIALLAGVVGVSAIDRGAGLEDGIYAIGVDPTADDAYADVIEQTPQVTLVETTVAEFRAGESDADALVLGPGRVLSDGTTTGDAAREAFREAVVAHNAALMRAEPDEAAAYPVVYSIQYQARDLASSDGASGAPAGSDPGGDRGGDSSSGSDGGVQTGGGTTDRSGDGDDASDGGRLGIPDVGGGALESETEVGTPGALSPPFPFESLVLAFLFVVPMNLVVQAYGSSIVEERINRRGELLLVSPASRHEIVAGKTLPYLLGLVGIAIATTVVVDGGPLSVAAATPVALLFLAATFVGGMFARSFKELTFVTVAISVFLTTYTFVPAIFADVTPIALISPLTLVVMDLQGETASLGEYAFSTGPFYLASAVLFLLGVGVYREEDMFTQRSVPAKAVDAVAGRVRGVRSVPLLSMLFIPFVFVVQLLLVALLFAVPIELALPILLVASAAVEELAKSVHVYAGFARSRVTASIRTAVALGALAGAGFFVGEKFTHVVQFVGLPDLEVGQAVFGPVLSGGPLVALALFLTPLVLHACTAVISAIGASRGRTTYAGALVVATLVHAGYNLGVLTFVA